MKLRFGEHFSLYRFNHNESLIFQWTIDSSIRFYLGIETRHNARIENASFTVF